MKQKIHYYPWFNILKYTAQIFSWKIYLLCTIKSVYMSLWLLFLPSTYNLLNNVTNAYNYKVNNKVIFKLGSNLMLPKDIMLYAVEKIILFYNSQRNILNNIHSLIIILFPRFIYFIEISIICYKSFPWED